MSYISSAIKSINVYSGSVSCAASFTGDKDITITAVIPGKSVLLPYLVGSPTVANGNTTVIATSDNTNLSFDHFEFASNTTVRLKTVVNLDGGAAHNIRYAFAVVEFK